MPPPTREVTGIGAPGPPPPPTGPPPGPSGSSSAVYAVVGILLILAVAGVALFVATDDDDDESSNGDGTELSTGGSTGGSTDLPGSPGGGGAGSGGTVTTTTVPTTPPTTPAQAEVNDCIQVGYDGGFIGAGSCAEGGAPYTVVEVVPLSGSCGTTQIWTSSGDYLLCLNINLVETYCYDFPDAGSTEFIVPALACETPGTVHVIDLLPGATNDSGCTTQYQWNRWYEFTYPQMVACVMQY